MPRTAIYDRIADHFRKQIRDGALQAGDQMPSIREIMSTFKVANGTASRAYKALKEDGLIYTTVGAGTVVAVLGSDNVAARVMAHATTGRALAAGETSEVLEVGMVGADEVVAARLGINPGSPVNVRRRLVSRNGTPVHMSSSFYPSFVIDAAPELTAPVSTGGSRELAAERLGIRQARALEEVTSRFATDPEKDALGLTGSVIVTQVVRTVFLADGRIVEVAVKIASGSTVLKWSTPLMK